MNIVSIRVFLVVFALACGWQQALAGCDEQMRSPTCGSTPSAQFDAEGRLWVAFVDNEHVYLSRSTDAGLTYEPAVRVNDEPEEIYSDGENRAVLALGDDGEIFVAWTRKNSEPYSGDIRYARSVDGGGHFATPVTINDDGLQTSHRFVAMMVSPSGLLYLAWLDKRDQVAALAAGEDYVGAALYYTVSSDNGASFAANRKVGDNSCECCRLALALAGQDRIQVFWRHTFDDSRVRDHAMATLGPVTASAVQRATRDDWRIDGCPHHGPALAADGEGGFHMAWFSNGNNNQGVMYGFYDGETGETRRVAVIDARPSGGHPAVMSVDDVVTVVWKSFDGKNMNLRLLRSLDGGEHWETPVTIASTKGSSDHPLLLNDRGAVHVAWHTAAEGYRLLPLPTNLSGD